MVFKRSGHYCNLHHHNCPGVPLQKGFLLQDTAQKFSIIDQFSFLSQQEATGVFVSLHAHVMHPPHVVFFFSQHLILDRAATKIRPLRCPKAEVRDFCLALKWRHIILFSPAHCSSFPSLDV